MPFVQEIEAALETAILAQSQADVKYYLLGPKARATLMAQEEAEAASSNLDALMAPFWASAQGKEVAEALQRLGWEGDSPADAAGALINFLGRG